MIHIKRFASMMILGVCAAIPAQAADATVQQLIDTEIKLFQDLKYYMGVTSANTMGAQNLLLYMLPPYLDITQAVGSQMMPADEKALSTHEAEVRAFANYNLYTPEQSRDGYYNDYIAFCAAPAQKSNKICDFAVANSGDNQLAIEFLDKDAYTNDTDKLAALQFIRYLTNPRPLSFDKDKVYNDPEDLSKGLTEDGKKYFDNAFKQLPMLSLAQNSLLAIYAERTRVPDIAKGLPVGKDGAASIMEMLNYEATRRYSNPDWSNAMNKLSGVAVSREMANMKAFEIYLRVKEYQQASRMEALMATQVSLLVLLNAQMQGTGSTGGEDVDVTKTMEETIGQ
jgi:hypothetical protein